MRQEERMVRSKIGLQKGFVKDDRCEEVRHALAERFRVSLVPRQDQTQLEVGNGGQTLGTEMRRQATEVVTNRGKPYDSAPNQLITT